MAEKKEKNENKNHSLPLHFLSRTNKENHMQSTIWEETRRVREDLDIKRQDKRRRKPRSSWRQQGTRRRTIETFEGEGVPRSRKHN